MKMSDLIITKDLDAPAVFADQASIDSILAQIKEKATAVVPKVTTKSGRKEIGSLAHRVARTKTLLDNAGAGLVNQYRKKVQDVDAKRRYIREKLDALKAEVRRPLTEFEEREAARVASIQAKIAEMQGLMYYEESDFNLTHAELVGRHEALYDFPIGKEYDEFASDALAQKETGLIVLEARIKELREEEERELLRTKAAEERAAQEQEKITDAVVISENGGEENAGSKNNIPNEAIRSAADGRIETPISRGKAKTQTVETKTPNQVDEGGQSFDSRARPVTVACPSILEEIAIDLRKFGAPQELSDVIAVAIQHGMISHVSIT